MDEYDLEDEEYEDTKKLRRGILTLICSAMGLICVFCLTVFCI